MPRDVTVQVYRFAELPEAGKDRVRQKYREEQFEDGHDAVKSLEALARHFGGRMRDWEMDWSNCSYSSAKFEMPTHEDYACDDMEQIAGEHEVVRDERVARAWREHLDAKLLEISPYFDPVTLVSRGEQNLTGSYFDDTAIDAFRAALAGGETDLDALMQAAFDAVLKVGQAEVEHRDSDEGIAEDCEARDRWFYDDGRTAAEPPDPGKGRFSKAATERATAPHGRCFLGLCVEHAQDRHVPACKLDKGRRRKRTPPRR